MAAIKAVAIDLDGTLLHTAPDLALAANRTLAEFGHPEIEDEVVMTYVGNGAVALVKRLLTGKMDGEPDPERLAQAMDVFFRHYAAVLDVRTTLYAGVREGVDALLAAGLGLACITNKPACFTEPLLASKGLRDAFSLVLSGDSLPEKKPHPMPLLTACEHFGITPESLLMVGDSAADAAAARAAGCPVLVVSYGYNRGMPASTLNSDGVIDSLLDIMPFITQQNAIPS